MHLGDFISPDSVVPSLKVKNKKQLLQELSARAARLTGLEERYIFDVLLQRERLGSTGLGQGIAIPHGKFAGLKRIVGITTYGRPWWNALLVGDPPKKIVTRYLPRFSKGAKVDYYPLYHMNVASDEKRKAFVAKVRAAMVRF